MTLLLVIVVEGAGGVRQAIPHLPRSCRRQPLPSASLPGRKEECVVGARAVQWALPSAKTSA